MRSASCTCGSNLPSVATRHEALAVEELLELAVDELDALLELRLLVSVRRLERSLEVVEHRQELLHEPLAGPRDQALLVARGPLAVVVELGLEPLERVDQLLVLVAQRLELDLFGRLSDFATDCCKVSSGLSLGCSSAITTSSPPLLRR